MVTQKTMRSQDTEADEGKHDRFRRLAEKRVVRAIKDIRLIGNLGNRNNYEYTSDEVDKIFGVLAKELKLARGKFGSRARDDGVGFSFEDGQ